MIACLIHPDAANQRANSLATLLETLGYSLMLKDSLEAAAEEPKLQSGRRDTILVVPATDDWRPVASDVVALARKFVGRAFVIFVCDEISPDEYKALLRTGAGDCVDWRNCSKEIIAISQRLRGEASVGSMEPIAPPADEKDVARQLIIGFLPAGGGVGNTTLALETGVYCSRLKGNEARRTAAIELDFNHSVMCEHVDLTPRLDIAELARNPRRLDDYMLDIFRSRHSSGLDMFSATHAPVDCCSIDTTAVFALLNRLHDRYEILLLDFANYRTAWVDQALLNCDFVFVTGRHSVPSLKQVARELKRLRDLGFDAARTAAVVTHCEASLIGGVAGKGNIEAALAGSRVFFIREDKSFALEAVNSGASMIEMRAGRGICREIRLVADVLRTLTPREVS
jgi:pilus assembly protein CpaE